MWALWTIVRVFDIMEKTSSLQKLWWKVEELH